MNGGLGQTQFLGCAADAPVGAAVGGLSMKCLPHQLHDLIFLDRARSTGTRFVIKAHETLKTKPLSPLSNGLPGDAYPLGNGAMVQLLGAEQHDLSPLYQPRGQGPRSPERLELITHFVTQCDRQQDATRHEALSG
jgi:hypothetical protein